LPGLATPDRRPYPSQKAEVTVTTETIEPTAAATASISVQQSAAQALTALAAQYPTLPAAYITIHHPFELRPGRLDLQFSSWQEFELWREALEIAPDEVTLHFSGVNSWIAGVTTVLDTEVEISGFGIALNSEQYTAPRTVTEVAA